jgi:hypothetical protein
VLESAQNMHVCDNASDMRGGVEVGPGIDHQGGVYLRVGGQDKVGPCHTAPLSVSDYGTARHFTSPVETVKSRNSQEEEGVILQDYSTATFLFPERQIRMRGMYV